MEKKKVENTVVFVLVVSCDVLDVSQAKWNNFVC